jgi:hypothetical protein
VKAALEVFFDSFILIMVLEGRRIASGASRGRKVRTPQGVMPRNSGFNRRYTRAESWKTFRRKVPQKIRPPSFRLRDGGKGEKVV